MCKKKKSGAEENYTTLKKKIFTDLVRLKDHGILCEYLYNA